jgi:hypothetical protein
VSLKFFRNGGLDRIPSPDASHHPLPHGGEGFRSIGNSPRPFGGEGTGMRRGQETRLLLEITCGNALARAPICAKIV